MALDSCHNFIGIYPALRLNAYYCSHFNIHEDICHARLSSDIFHYLLKKVTCACECPFLVL